MSSRADAVVARARGLIGVRFRPQGRGAEEGLDCVGLAAAALGIESVRSDYALRGGSERALEEALREVGLVRRSRLRAGDLLVLRAGPGQLHLGIWTGEGLVHADAGLKRVVERPGRPPWAVVSAWGQGEDREMDGSPSTIAVGGGPPPRAGEE